MTRVISQREGGPAPRAPASMRRYLAVLMVTLGVMMGVVLALNLVLGDRGLGNAQSTRAASLWQQTTRGVTYAPPTGGTGPFKVLRLADRLPEINTVVLGSSTLMGVTQNLFPAEWRIYNMTVTGNSTSAIAGEARYIEQHFADRVRHMMVGLDWAVGTIYLPGGVTDSDLSASSVESAYRKNVIPFHKRIEDALSWPRVATLGTLVAAALKSAEPISNLRRAFFDIGGTAYRCADGALARDFDVINRGLCRGYRYDGSWTFANDSRLTPAQAAMLAAAAAAPSSRYTRHLCATQGEPNAEYLRHLGETARRYAAKGGRMIFVLPALAPGMEKTLLSTPQWKACLGRTKSTLDAWARRHQVSIIDAGASERYGCQPAEFVDEHHAYPECNQRMLQRFFRDLDANHAGDGLYRPAAP